MLRLLLRRGVRNGLFGGSRFWLVVGGGAAAVRLFQRFTGRLPEIVYSEKLEPGQTLVISHPMGD